MMMAGGLLMKVGPKIPLYLARPWFANYPLRV